MEPQDVIVTWRKMQPGAREALMIFGTLLLLVTVLLIWAVFLRKRRRRHRYHYPQARGGGDAVPPNDSPTPHKSRRRREHRPRNPTLAETGGLPPIRPDGPPPMP